jgi:hypothetical protein
MALAAIRFPITRLAGRMAASAIPTEGLYRFCSREGSVMYEQNFVKGKAW